MGASEPPPPPPPSHEPGAAFGAAPAVAVPRPTNGFAIASFVFGLLGGVVLALIFGIVALVQIRRRGQHGKLLAIAGLVLSGLWSVIIAAGVFFALTGNAERDNTTGEIATGGYLPVDELRPGDCVNGLSADQLNISVDAVPCSQPHEGEVVGTFEIRLPELPPEAELVQMAGTGCEGRLTSYAQVENDPSLEIFYLHPTEDSWSEGDRVVTCLARHVGGRKTGSIRR